MNSKGWAEHVVDKARSDVQARPNWMREIVRFSGGDVWHERRSYGHSGNSLEPGKDVEQPVNEKKASA